MSRMSVERSGASYPALIGEKRCRSSRSPGYLYACYGRVVRLQIGEGKRKLGESRSSSVRTPVHARRARRAQKTPAVEPCWRSAQAWAGERLRLVGGKRTVSSQDPDRHILRTPPRENDVSGSSTCSLS